MGSLRSVLVDIRFSENLHTYSPTFFSETRMGMDMQSLTVSEEVESGQVEVCVVVFIPAIPCPIAFPFEIHVHTKPNTASEASNAVV